MKPGGRASSIPALRAITAPRCPDPGAATGRAPVAANLILLGYAVGQGALFCGPELMEKVITDKSPARFRESNLQAFGAGVEAAAA